MYKAGFVGLIGQPNAGKSTLMNFLVKEKVSIVTSKPQTTRRRILGITSSENYQIVFVDAPGIIEKDKGLNGFLALEAHDVIEQSDVLLVVLSVDEKESESLEQVLKLIKQSNKPWVAVITKVDLEKYAHRIGIIKTMIEAQGGKCYTSSIQGDINSEDAVLLREEIINQLVELLPVSPQPLFDTEIFTNESVRDIAAEIIREKCFESFAHEIPYSIAVRIIKYEETNKIDKIYAEIIVAKENHKSIVIGKGGEMIKKIGTESRLEIEKVIDKKVFLDLNVTFRDKWFLNTNIMKELRYVVPKN